MGSTKSKVDGAAVAAARSECTGSETPLEQLIRLTKIIRQTAYDHPCKDFERTSRTLERLNELSAEVVSLENLANAKTVETLKELCGHDDKNIATMTKRIIKKWRAGFEASRQR